MESLIPLFWTSDDMWSGFQSQDGSFTCVVYSMHAKDSSDSPLSVTHTDLLVANMAAKRFWFAYLHLQALVGLEPTFKRAAAQCSRSRSLFAPACVLVRVGCRLSENFFCTAKRVLEIVCGTRKNFRKRYCKNFDKSWSLKAKFTYRMWKWITCFSDKIFQFQFFKKKFMWFHCYKKVR